MLTIQLFMKCNIYDCKNPQWYGNENWLDMEWRSGIFLLFEIKLCETSWNSIQNKQLLFIYHLNYVFIGNFKNHFKFMIYINWYDEKLQGV